jgi:hypothetical protein
MVNGYSVAGIAALNFAGQNNQEHQHESFQPKRVMCERAKNDKVHDFTAHLGT